MELDAETRWHIERIALALEQIANHLTNPSKENTE